MGEDTAGDYGGGDPPKEEQPWDRKTRHMAWTWSPWEAFGDGMGRGGERSSARTMQACACQGREGSDPMESGVQCAAGATPVVDVGLDSLPVKKIKGQSGRAARYGMEVVQAMVSSE